MLQSPAPALIKMDPPLSGPSMKARSLMVPSCMLNSRSGPESVACIWVETQRFRSCSVRGDRWFTRFTRTKIYKSHTCGIAAVCIERQDFDVFIIGAGSQQLSTVAPGHTVDRALVMFVPSEAHRRLLDCTRATEGANTFKRRMKNCVGGLKAIN